MSYTLLFDLCIMRFSALLCAEAVHGTESIQKAWIGSTDVVTSLSELKAFYSRNLGGFGSDPLFDPFRLKPIKVFDFFMFGTFM